MMNPTVHKRLPSAKQLMLPLTAVLQENGGGTTSDIIAALADRLEIPEDLRDRRELVGREWVNLFRRRVRWVRQTLVDKGVVDGRRKGWWQLTECGKEALRNCLPGVIVTVYENDLGAVLWAEAEDAARTIQPGSINLLFTSPPYPLINPKAYGNRTEQDYLDWMLRHTEQWRNLLTDDGSLVLNLGDAWIKGVPEESAYRERLLINLLDRQRYHLAQKWYWNNPGKPPSSHWVTIKKVRATSSVELLLWLGKTPHVKADVTKILQPYKESMLKILARGGDCRNSKRPSGHGNARVGFAKDNGGRIPFNIISCGNSESNTEYLKFCKSNGLPIHPARFPGQLPETFIKLTTSPGDLVADFFGGSLTTAKKAVELGRRFVTSDKSLSYLMGGALSRLRSSPGFTDLTEEILLGSSPSLQQEPIAS